MKIISLDELEKVPVDMAGAKNLFKQVPISGKDESPIFCFRVFTVEPEGHTPYHTHPFEHLNFVIEGTGVLVNEAGDEKRLKKGDFAIVLPEEKHCYKNASTDNSFVMICAVPKEYE